MLLGGGYSVSEIRLSRYSVSDSVSRRVFTDGKRTLTVRTLTPLWLTVQRVVGVRGGGVLAAR